MSSLISFCLEKSTLLLTSFYTYNLLKSESSDENNKQKGVILGIWIFLAIESIITNLSEFILRWFPFYYEIKILLLLFVVGCLYMRNELAYQTIVAPIMRLVTHYFIPTFLKCLTSFYSSFLTVCVSIVDTKQLSKIRKDQVELEKKIRQDYHIPEQHHKGTYSKILNSFDEE
ncbi:hypothetical protein WA158_008528 [Blastocystis sp. Blastoise]